MQLRYLRELLPRATCRTGHTGAIRAQKLGLLAAELGPHQHAANLGKSTF